MPRKKAEENKKEVPKYIDPKTGVLDFSLIFKHQPAQLQLLKNVTRNGHPYLMPIAPQLLSTGGVRAGKTLSAMMFGIQHYCLKYKKCDMLILRRTFPELENGAIADFLAFMPKELYSYDQSRHIATLINGSRVVFAHCEHGKDRDVEKFLGQAFSIIICDECGQFSPEAWQYLYSRNTPNAGCEPDEFGNMPIPVIWGTTNPIGPHYEYYRTLFVQKEPWNKPEGAKRDNNGTWWVPDAGEWRLIYDPRDYACQRITVLDNPAMLKRDPGIISRLSSLPQAKRQKMLLGLDGNWDGQYFDCWSEEYHTINLREDPEAIVWQYHQPCWAGQDWGMSHANAVHFFTKALVRKAIGTDYALKTVCFQELVVTGGKTYRELASLVAAKAKYPDGKPCEVRHLFFSHEKFARQMDTHAPAYDYSKELRKYGLPAVTPATRDRVGSASMMYNMLKQGELVILDHCREIILAIPSLMRDKNNIDDVLKTEAKMDDVYDSFRYSIYGMLATKQRPVIDSINEHAKSLGFVEAWFYKQKKLSEMEGVNEPFLQPSQPIWMGKLNL